MIFFLVPKPGLGNEKKSAFQHSSLLTSSFPSPGLGTRKRKNRHFSLLPLDLMAVNLNPALKRKIT